MAHDIFNISDILQASFDLERGNPRIDQLAYTVRQIQIPHRQQMPPLDDPYARTRPPDRRSGGRAGCKRPVTAAFAHRTRQETAAAVPHADRPVDETLQIAPGRRRGSHGSRRTTRPAPESRGQSRSAPEKAPAPACVWPPVSKRATRPADSSAAAPCPARSGASTPAAISSLACRSASANSAVIEQRIEQ